jgi:hypothetical protein
VADTAMVEAPRCVLLLGLLSHTTHSECSVADGSPGELRGGKRIADRGALGPAESAASGAPPVAPPVTWKSLRR